MSEEQTKEQILVDEVGKFLKEYQTFSDKGNKSAGTRARKSLSTISKLAKEIRQNILREAKD